DLPGTVLIGVGEGGMRGGFGHAQMPQLAFGGAQTLFDFAQALGLAKPAKEHRDELIPAAEPARMALAPMLANGAVKQRRGNELQHLAENIGYSIHGAPSGRVASFVAELILTLAEERLFRGFAEDRPS